MNTVPERAATTLCIVLLGALLSSCAPQADRAQPPGPPRGLEYMPPEPGTYELPAIQTASDGWVLDADGTRRRLFDYLGDRLALLSFVYTRCHDGSGCPFATAMLRRIDQQALEQAGLADEVRLVTLSFDPERDRPESMRRYVPRKSYLETPWRERSWAFLTTESEQEIAPILDGFGQYVVKERGQDGKPTGEFTHVLKVFLIDRERRVRNIYSTSYLHPAILVGDLQTLALEEESHAP